jgi:acyl-ACP thioesterase
MHNTFDETFVLRTRDCDLTGKWRPSAILESMQEAAGMHSMLLGCGRDELIKNNIVWVLSRCELHMDRYPAVGEKVTVHTFPTPTRICFFPRYYIFTDEHGEMIGKAGSLWLLLDIHTRRMLPPGDVGKLIPDNKDLSIPMNLPATVGNLQGEEFVTEYHPVYTDLDVNGHVNNTRYADMLCNALGISIMTEYELERIILNYNHEILPDHKVTLRRILRGTEYRLSGRLDDDVSAFEIGGTLRKRV